MTKLSRAVAVLLAFGGSGCVERQASGGSDTASARALLQSGRVPLLVTSRDGLDAQGRPFREVLVRAERGSERWFERAGRELQLEVAGRRSSLSPRQGGLGARWSGGPGVLTWTAPDGSAGMRVELDDLQGAAERAPRFEPIRATGLIDLAVPTQVAP